MNGINGKLAAAHGHGARGYEFLEVAVALPELVDLVDNAGNGGVVARVLMAMPWAVFGMRYLSTVELVSSMSLRMPGMTAHEEQLTSKRALQTITTTPARLSTFSARIRQH